MRGIHGIDRLLRQNARISRESVRRARLRICEPQSFIGKKKEEFVFDDGAAQHASEVILVHHAAGQARSIENQSLASSNVLRK